MQPGALDQRITFQIATLVSDGQGGSTKTWAAVPAVPTVWAYVRDMSGREVEKAGGVAAEGRTLFVVRNRTDIDESLRISWGSLVYNIRHVRRAGPRRMYLEIEADRGVAT